MAVELVDNNNKIKVTYNDGSIVFIKPVPFSKLEIITSYLEVILEEAFKANMFVSSFLYKNSPIINAIKSIIKVLPVLSDNSDEKLDIDKLESLDDLISLFVTGEVNKNSLSGQLDVSKEYNTYLPSFIGVIHGINFFTMARKIEYKVKETNG